MAMAVDSRQQQHQFSPMGYDAMRYPSGPHFTNPWASAQPGQMYAASLPPSSENRYAPAPAVSQPYSGHIAAPALPSGITPMIPSLVGQSGSHYEDMSARAYPYNSTAPPPPSSFAPPTSAPYSAASYQPTYHADRRPSHPFHTATDAERQGYNDAMDASRGMLAMSQSDITPRNIYGTAPSNRSSTDSYGFPSGHSSHSSISSAAGYPTYYNSSVSEASVGDYGSTSENGDLPLSRTLPKPMGLGMPPAPQSMMGQFSSKVTSSSQKKHKCKICDKRFTRPSSLQTHMYSHTGEKPFACEVDGCGRHFSVVSNLRRHRKVHKGEGHDLGSPEEDDE